jgi:hypothetical protein
MRWIIAMACFSSSFVLSSAAQVDVVTLPGKAVLSLESRFSSPLGLLIPALRH